MDYRIHRGEQHCSPFARFPRHKPTIGNIFDEGINVNHE